MSEKYERIRGRLLKAKPYQFTSDLTCMTGLIEEESCFDTLKEFVTTPVGQGGLGMGMDQVNKLLWFNPSYKHEAEKLSVELGLAERAKQVPVLNGHGEVGNGRSRDNGSKNVMSNNRQGNDSTYRISKLKRDHPEVALMLEQGEFKNVAQAEREAGVKPPKREGKRLHIYKDDPISAIDSIIAYYGSEIINDAIIKQSRR